MLATNRAIHRLRETREREREREKYQMQEWFCCCCLLLRSYVYIRAGTHK